MLNNPLRYTDPTGHYSYEETPDDNFQWGFDEAGSLYMCARNCVYNPDRVITMWDFAKPVVALAAPAVIYAATPLVIESSMPYIYMNAARAQTAIAAAAAAHPTANAMAEGLAETAVECSLTGGNCTLLDYAVGAITAGAAHRLSTPCSFSANTPVMTEDGLVAIAEIEEGTWALAYNEATGEIDYYPVVATWAHEDPIIVYLTINGEVIETTPEHPFFVKDLSWIEAGELWVGAELRDANEVYGVVENIEFIHQTQTMYDLTVDSVHTFFVGKQQWLVHNCGGNTVYQSTNPDGSPEYVGITNNLGRRANEHRGTRDIEPILGLDNLSRQDARDVEEALIVHYDLDNLSNGRHEISPRRPEYQDRLTNGRNIINANTNMNIE